MPIETCQQHQQLAQIICCKDECKKIVCPKCFHQHAEIYKHYLGVKLNENARTFFIEWSQLLISKLTIFSDLIASKGYNQMFQMKLDGRYPRGSLIHIVDSQITEIAVQIIQNHLKIARGNLNFVQKSVDCCELTHPDFIKDLYNLLTEDANANLTIFCRNLECQLVQQHAQKIVYQYAKFNLIPRQIKLVQQQRKQLFLKFQQSILYKVNHPHSSRVRTTNSPSPLSKRHEEPISPLTNFKTEHHQLTHLKRSTPPSITHSGKNQKIIRLHTEHTQLQTCSRINEYRNDHVVQVGVEIPPNNHAQIQSITKKHQIEQKQMQNQIMQLTQQLIATQKENQTLKMEIRNTNQINRTNEDKDIQNKHLLQKIQKIQAENLSEKSKKNIQMLKNVTWQSKIIGLNAQIAKIMNKEPYAQQQRREDKHLDLLVEGVHELIERIKLSERSIRELNLLIGNEEQELSYRENESQTLTKEIKKLLHKIKFLERSIHELNNLIGNEEQQISYRENQCQRLTVEIKKLLMKIQEQQRSIKELNNLIGNQEQQIVYRETEVQTLTKENLKLINRVQYLENQMDIINSIQRQQQTQSDQLNTNQQQFQLQNQTLRRQQSHLKIEINSLKTLIKEKQAHIDKIQEINIKLQKCLSFIADILQIRKQDYNDWSGLTAKMCGAVQLYAQKVREKSMQQQIKRNLIDQNSMLKGEKHQLLQNLKQKDSQTVNDELVEQVIELESEVKYKSQDIDQMVKLLNGMVSQMSSQLRKHAQDVIGGLRTVRIQSK